jgi:uncharacterized Zn-binding protein involved in type VI secretion
MTTEKELIMNLRNLLVAGATALSLAAVPVAAQAATSQTSGVSKLSVRAAPAVRQGARVAKASKLEGGSIVIMIVAAAAVIAGVIVAADGSNTASSPS